MNPTLTALLAAAAAGTFVIQLAPTDGPAKGIATGIGLSLIVFWIPLAMLIDWVAG